MNIIKGLFNKEKFNLIIEELSEKYKLFLESQDRFEAKNINSSIEKNLLELIPRGYGSIIFDRNRKDTDDEWKEFSLNHYFYGTTNRLSSNPNIADIVYKQINKYNKGESKFKIPLVLLEKLGIEQHETDFASDTEKEERLKSVANKALIGAFWLFHFDYNDGIFVLSKKTSNVGIDLLEIKPTGEAIIKPASKSTKYFYTGQVVKLTQKHKDTVQIKLNAIDTPVDKPLTMTLYVPPTPNIELTMGHYTSKDTTNHLIRGSLIASRVDDNLKIENESIMECKQDQLEAFVERNKGSLITKEIAYFFRNKRMNYDKVPNLIFTHNAFSKWVIEKRALEKQRETDKFRLQNQLFISCPRGSLGSSKNELEAYKKVISEIMDINTNQEDFEQFDKIFSFFDDPHYEAQIQTTTRYLNTFEYLKNSSYHLAILPSIEKENQKMSSVLCEIGMSIAMNRPITVFYMEREQLPNIILAADKTNTSRLSLWEYRNPEEITTAFLLNSRDALFQH